MNIFKITKHDLNMIEHFVQNYSNYSEIVNKSIKKNKFIIDCCLGTCIVFLTISLLLPLNYAWINYITGITSLVFISYFTINDKISPLIIQQIKYFQLTFKNKEAQFEFLHELEHYKKELNPIQYQSLYSKISNIFINIDNLCITELNSFHEDLKFLFSEKKHISDNYYNEYIEYINKKKITKNHTNEINKSMNLKELL